MKKLFTLILVALVSVSAFSVNITGGTKLYLKPNSNWQQADARFAAYYFGDGEAWVSMTFIENHGGYPVYEAISPAGKNFTNVIFCRMNPNATANNWANKWNQTDDLTYDGTNNCFQVASGTWDKEGGTWSVYTPPVVLTPSIVLTVPASVFIDETISLNALSENVTNPVITYSVKVPGGSEFVSATSPYQPTEIGTYTFKAEVTENGAGDVLATDTKEVEVKVVPDPIVIKAQREIEWGNKVYMFVWGTDSDGFKEMTWDSSTGWYVYTFNRVEKANFLFVNVNDWGAEERKQTADITNVGASNCYRIYEEDGSAKSAERDCMGVFTNAGLNNTKDNHITISKNQLSVTLNDVAEIELYSISGQLLQKVTANKQFTQNLHTGVYILRVDGETHKVVVR